MKNAKAKVNANIENAMVLHILDIRQSRGSRISEFELGSELVESAVGDLYGLIAI